MNAIIICHLSIFTTALQKWHSQKRRKLRGKTLSFVLLLILFTKGIGPNKNSKCIYRDGVSTWEENKINSSYHHRSLMHTAILSFEIFIIEVGISCKIRIISDICSCDKGDNHYMVSWKFMQMPVTYHLGSLNTLHHSHISHVHKLNKWCKLFKESLTNKKSYKIIVKKQY